MTKPINHKPTLRSILETVSQEADVPVSSLKSASRQWVHVLPRYAYCYIAYEVYGYTLVQVGSYINRHHTTIMNACTQWELIEAQKLASAMPLIQLIQQKFPEMKKVTFKLKYDEMKALYDFIQDSIGLYPHHLPSSYIWQWRPCFVLP